MFAKMIDGGFKEAYEQVIDLPDDDPAVISLMIAYLYEGNYVPIKPAADAIGRLPL